MQNDTILKKAIKKAEKNGYDADIDKLKMTYKLSDIDDYSDIYKFAIDTLRYQAVIFSHNFAKAYWGIERTIRNYTQYKGEQASLRDWQYHLQQMVLEPEPLKYLEKFL